MVNTCKKCGDPAPSGKDLCWCCEHTPKLHRDEDNTDCEKDKSEKTLIQESG